jgi:hypothetical protein
MTFDHRESVSSRWCVPLPAHGLRGRGIAMARLGRGRLLSDLGRSAYPHLNLNTHPTHALTECNTHLFTFEALGY